MTGKYLVTATLKFPACYHRGYEYAISAKTRQEAISAARRQVYHDGHTRQDGPLVFSARRADA